MNDFDSLKHLHTCKYCERDLHLEFGMPWLDPCRCNCGLVYYIDQRWQAIERDSDTP